MSNDYDITNARCLGTAETILLMALFGFGLDYAVGVWMPCHTGRRIGVADIVSVMKMVMLRLCSSFCSVFSLMNSKLNHEKFIAPVNVTFHATVPR